MLKVISASILLALLCSMLAFAQAPTGTISGTVTDESGAVIPNATVTITDKATGFTRSPKVTAEGLFSASALSAGVYEVRIEAAGFRTVVRDATVETGATTAVNTQMQVGGTKEVVTVEAATAQVEYERHA